MSRNEMNVKTAFKMFYTVMEEMEAWCESDLKNNIIELNKMHLLDNLDKALVQANDDINEGVNNEI